MSKTLQTFLQCPWAWVVKHPLGGRPWSNVDMPYAGTRHAVEVYRVVPSPRRHSTLRELISIPPTISDGSAAHGAGLVPTCLVACHNLRTWSTWFEACELSSHFR